MTVGSRLRPGRDCPLRGAGVLAGRSRGRRIMSERFEVTRRREQGAAGWGLLWLIGIPIPVLIILFVLRGCT